MRYSRLLRCSRRRRCPEMNDKSNWRGVQPLKTTNEKLCYESPEYYDPLRYYWLKTGFKFALSSVCRLI